MSQLAPCPVCATPRARRPHNPWFPFCSERCKWVDLGKWMGEDYVISEPLAPGVTPEDDDEAAAQIRRRLH